MAQAPIQYGELRLDELGTKLFVPHNGGELTFLYPSYGPGTYANVGLSIARENLGRPTMAETVSLVYAVFDSDSQYGQEIKGIIRREWMWAFTGTVYVPNEGAFIQDDPEIKCGMYHMDIGDLVQRLNAGDHSVRFVPFGYKVGEMSPSELAKNPYVIGLVGEEGAENLARIASKYHNNPYLRDFEFVGRNTARVSALFSGIANLGLNISGGHGIGNGHAFGLSGDTSRATRAEK